MKKEDRVAKYIYKRRSFFERLKRAKKQSNMRKSGELGWMKYTLGNSSSLRRNKNVSYLRITKPLEPEK